MFNFPYDWITSLLSVIYERGIVIQELVRYWRVKEFELAKHKNYFKQCEINYNYLRFSLVIVINLDTCTVYNTIRNYMKNQPILGEWVMHKYMYIQ